MTKLMPPAIRWRSPMTRRVETGARSSAAHSHRLLQVLAARTPFRRFPALGEIRFGIGLVGVEVQRGQREQCVALLFDRDHRLCERRQQDLRVFTAG